MHISVYILYKGKYVVLSINAIYNYNEINSIQYIVYARYYIIYIYI